MTTALPPHVVEDRRGRAVLMHGGTVGDGRGGSGSSRIPVGGRAAGLSRVPGRAAAVGMGAAAFGFLAPVPGALYQEAIDVAVILNALRTARE